MPQVGSGPAFRLALEAELLRTCLPWPFLMQTQMGCGPPVRPIHVEWCLTPAAAVFSDGVGGGVSQMNHERNTKVELFHLAQ